MASSSIGTPVATARSSFIVQPSNTSANSTLPVLPPDLEQSLATLSSHRSVLGFMFLSRGLPVSIIRHSGVIFEGEQGKKYAGAISRIVESVQSGLEEVQGEVAGNDHVRFMRIRTKRHEIMISPSTNITSLPYFTIHQYEPGGTLVALMTFRVDRD